jgi:diguanylate cyclase (GGDEF)-like protein
MTILVVDDDSDQLNALSACLNAAGYRVLTARNGHEALHVLLTEGPPLVITDWKMPAMNGIDFCRSIRRHEGILFVYIILLTAQNDEEHMAEAFKAGADDFLPKPFQRRELLARVQAGERLTRLHADLEHQRRELHRVNAEMAVANQQLADVNVKLIRLATSDELTGLVNRREAMSRMAEYWAASVRHGDSLACIAVDIDHFKSFNDRFGHATGDFVLKETASILRWAARREESVCRVGGEEFLVLCPKATAVKAAVGAERLRMAVESQRWCHEAGILRATISLGVAERTEEMTGPEDLLNAADAALYEAKKGGRNRVCSARAATENHEFEPGNAGKDGGGSPVELERRVDVAKGPASKAKTRVLVALESADDRRRCESALHGAGCIVVSGGNNVPQSALIDCPDVILLDSGAAASGAGDCLGRLAAQPRTRDIPVILLADAIPIHGADAGNVVEFVRVPLRPDELVWRVGTMARFRRELAHSNGIRGEQTRALDLLLTFSRDIAGAESLDAILDATLSAAAALTCSRRVCVLLPDDAQAVLTARRGLGLTGDSLEALRVPVGCPTSGEVFATREPRVFHSPEEARQSSGDPDYAFFTGTPSLSTPMCAPEGVVGVLNIAGRADASPFTALDLEYVDLVCNIAASAVHDCLAQRARDDARDSIVVALAKLAEFRDTDTGRHLDRVTQFSLVLARRLRELGRYAEEINDAFLADLKRAVPLHDIGKVAVPDRILRKPGRLDDDEVRVMQTHARIGAATIRSVIDRAPGARFLELAERIAGSHHEWYNGRGYPCGLKAGEIPLAARIVAVADVYDALTTRRVYKSAIPHTAAFDIIVQSAGGQFDPEVVEAFRRCDEDFARLARELADDPEPPTSLHPKPRTAASHRPKTTAPV